MTVVVGDGAGNLAPWYVLSGAFSFTAIDSTEFIASNFYGTLVVFGSDFTYAPPNLITAGTITGVGYAQTGAGSEGWAGFNVSAVAAYNTIATQNLAAFGNLFFGGDDTFYYTNPGIGAGTIPNPALMGFGGNDVFYITDTTGGALGAIDGGSGNDTMFLAGDYFTELPPPYNQTVLPNFHVSNIETINLAAGYDYVLRPDASLVTAGNTTRIDASTLGASNALLFFTNSYTGFGIATPAGNLELLGGAGDDLFQGGSGSNLFNGGAGTDVVSFDTGNLFFNGNTGVTVNLSISGPQSIGGPVGGLDTFISIEDLIGTSRNDVLTGDAGNNVLDGGSGGADVLNGGAGEDVLIGGGSGSVLDGGSGVDIAVFFVPYSTPSYSGRTVTVGGQTLVNVEFGNFNGQIVQIAGPQVTSTTKRIAAGQTVALSSLVSAVDLTGDTITTYQLWDGSSDPNSGHFVVNGVVQPARNIITVTAAEFAQTSFVAGTVNDNLQIRAFDGNSWSARDNATWAPFTVGPTVNHTAVVTPQILPPLQHGQSLALSSLISVSDADNDAITKYQLWDGNGSANSGYFTINGQPQAARTVIEVPAAQLGQVSFVVGSFPAGSTNTFDTLQIRAFDGFGWSAADAAAWSPFNVGVPANNPPWLSGGNYGSSAHQTIALSTLLSYFGGAHDGDGDTITKYQLWDSTRDPLSGNWVVNGIAKAPGTLIEITASQVAQTSFVTSRVNDVLQIRAFDGIDWSTPDNAAWPSITIDVSNSIPVVTTFDMHASDSQILPLSSMFTLSDADSDAMTRYQLWDGTPDPASGHFVVNGIDQPAGAVIDISPTQFSQTSFVAGTVDNRIQIRAFDGIDWSAPDSSSWSPFIVYAPGNHAPAVTTMDRGAPHDYAFWVPDLFSVSDVDGDSMTKYQLWDGSADPGSGHFIVNGIVQAARTIIDVTATQMANTFFVTGKVSDNLQIRAFDGTAWSAADSAAWSPFTLSLTNHPPIVVTGPLNAHPGQTLGLNTLFGAVEPDGDNITAYQLWDNSRDPNSGHFVVNGITQAAGTVINITAAQFGLASFVAGTVSDTLQIRASDGQTWSAADDAAWSPFTVTPSNTAPAVTTGPLTLPHSQDTALSAMFSVSDADNDTITRYQLWDATRGASSGNFVVGGVVQAPGTVVDITAAQLPQTVFRAGTVGDDLQIRAFDGYSWSAADTATWAPFHVSVN